MGSNQVDGGVENDAAAAAIVYSCHSEDYSAALLESLNQQRMQGILCDTKIEVENRTFNAHANVLASSLGYFRDLLKKDQLPGYHRITEIVNAAGFSKLLDFVYTSQLQLSKNSAMDVMCAAAYLQSSFVVSKCQDFCRTHKPKGHPLTDAEQTQALAIMPPQSASELLHQLSNINEPRGGNGGAAPPGSSRMRNNNHHQQQQQAPPQHVRKASSPKRLRDDYDVMNPTGIKRRMPPPTPRANTASPSATGHRLMNGGIMTSASTSPFNYGAATSQLLNQQQSSAAAAAAQQPGTSSASAANASGLMHPGARGGPSQLGGYFNYNSGAQSSELGNGGGSQHSLLPFHLSLYQAQQQSDFQQHGGDIAGTSNDQHKRQTEHSPFQHLLSMPNGTSVGSPSNGPLALERFTTAAAAMRLMTQTSMALSALPSHSKVVSSGTYNVGTALATSSDRRLAVPGDEQATAAAAAAARRSRSDRTDTRNKEKKEYFCTACPKSFGRQQHLKRHILTHTGERPYPCTLCDKRFRRSEHLKHHMTSHTNSDGTAVAVPQPKRRRRRQDTSDIYQMSRQLLAANAPQHSGGLFPVDQSQASYPYPNGPVILPWMASASDGNGASLAEISNNNTINSNGGGGEERQHVANSASSPYDFSVTVSTMPDDEPATAENGSNNSGGGNITELEAAEQSPSHEVAAAATVNGASPQPGNEDSIASRPGSSAASNSNSSGSPSMPDAAATAPGTGSSASSTPPSASQADQQQQQQQPSGPDHGAASSPPPTSPVVDVNNSEVLTEDMKQLMRSMDE